MNDHVVADWIVARVSEELEIDYGSLVGELDYNELASGIDMDNLVGAIDIEEVATYVELNDDIIRAKVAEWCYENYGRLSREESELIRQTVAKLLAERPTILGRIKALFSRRRKK
jgi:hypothetical protein